MNTTTHWKISSHPDQTAYKAIWAGIKNLFAKDTTRLESSHMSTHMLKDIGLNRDETHIHRPHVTS